MFLSSQGAESLDRVRQCGVKYGGHFVNIVTRIEQRRLR